MNPGTSSFLFLLTKYVMKKRKVQDHMELGQEIICSMSRSAKSSLSTIQIQSGKLTLNPLVCMSTPNVCCKHPFLWPQKTCSPPSPINGFRLHSFAKCRQGLIRVQPSGEAASHHNMKTSWVQFQVLRDKKNEMP